MQPPHQQSRINLAELKAQIAKKLGPEGSKQYFYYLNRFLCLKLSKSEFNKICHRILGHDNIPLHNHFIRSILKNAYSSKSPPPVGTKDNPADGYLQNGSHTNMARNRKIGDLSRGLIQKPENENGISGPAPADVAVLTRPQDGLGPMYSKEGSFVRSQLRAPLGVPFCPVSIGGAHRGASGKCIISACNDSLLDSPMLRQQMERIAGSHGLEGVSVECANILNHGLDSYMKGLIKCCVQLVGAKSGNGLPQSNIRNTHKKVTCIKPINGVKPGFQYQMQERKVSMQDFRVAMETSPSQLGEDWPLLLEKICTKAFEE